MRPSARISVHRPYVGTLGGPVGGGYESATEGPEKFQDRPCYVFNRSLPGAYDDKHCTHCRHYLTARCPHIDEFIDDVEDMAPE